MRPFLSKAGNKINMARFMIVLQVESDEDEAAGLLENVTNLVDRGDLAGVYLDDDAVDFGDAVTVTKVE